MNNKGASFVLYGLAMVLTFDCTIAWVLVTIKLGFTASAIYPILANWGIASVGKYRTGTVQNKSTLLKALYLLNLPMLYVVYTNTTWSWSDPATVYTATVLFTHLLMCLVVRQILKGRCEVTP